MKSCINCNKELNDSDKFCPECGQSTTNKLNLNILFSDLIGNYLSFDARFFKTIIPLLFKPGFIAKAFIDGKRNTYLHPGKIYLFISVLFFFFLSIKTSSFRSEMNDSVYEGLTENIHISDSLLSDSLLTDSTSILSLNSTQLTDSASIFSFNSSQNSFSSFSNSESLTNNYETYLESDNVMIRQIGKILNKKGQNMFDVFFGMLSIAIFLLVPVYAFFLKLLFYKNHSFTQHLVFSLYLFAFGFLLSILYLSLYNIDTSDYILLISSIIFFIYLTFAFKHFYNKSLGKSFIRACIQSTVFITVLVPTTFILLILSSILLY